MYFRAILACAFGLPVLSTAVSAQEFGAERPAVRLEKRALDHADYDRWNRIQGESLSPDGQWVVWIQSPAKEDADATLIVKSLSSHRRFEVVRGGRPQFSRDSRFLLYRVDPDREAVEKAKKDKAPAAEQPKASLEILELQTGEVTRIPRVKGFSLPEESGAFAAIWLEQPIVREEPAAEEKTEEGGAAVVPTPTGEPGEAAAKPEEPVAREPGQKAPEPKKKGEPEAADKTAKKDKKDKPRGSELILRRLADATERRFPKVLAYELSRDGRSAAIVSAGEGPESLSVRHLSLETGERRSLLEGDGEVRGLTFDESGERLAFLFRVKHPEEEKEEGGEKKGEKKEKKPEEPWQLLTWSGGEQAESAVAGDRIGWPAGFEISENRSPSFSKSGERILFGIAPRTPEEPEKDDDEPEVTLDIWHWRDPLLQPQQLRTVSQERRRSFLAVAQPAARRVVVLGREEIPDVDLAQEGDGRWALGSSNLPYQQRISWDSPRYYDHYIIDVETGRAEPILEDVQASASLSPEGRYVTWWDGNERSWLAYSIESGETVDLTEHLPHPVWNFEGDTPSIPRPWGSPGWATDDQMFLVYDAFDLWAVSPDGLWPPVCITEGVGRATGTRYRRIRLDREERAVPLDEPFLLSTFEEKTKDEGFARDRIRSTTQPKQLLEAAARFSTPRRAEDGDRLLFTQETFERFPDLWVSDLDLQDARQISHANPQQSEYSWGTAELTHWTSLDGVELEGLLYKPEGFDPSRRYPMMVYFYEKNSDALHRYVTPAPARASVNYSFYVSRGYVVFVPDIPYKTGYPGLSALNAVLPGVSALIDRGFVDRERIGVQGHSWGGYQVAYLVTKTDLFAAAEAGAPVSNMVSAYGGIRWSSGMSRMFQYERTQSRIGGTLWDETLHFIENSPVFWLESVTTPLLILHNDEDGAVPWYQGIELFVGLRRLGKPAWLFNYNGEQHGLTRDHNRRDWSVRLQQFFDHYLMDAPPPVWLERGVPAVEKGRDLGLDLIGAPSEDPATLAIAAKRAHDGKLAEWFGPEILAEKIRFESEDGLEIPAYRFVGKEGPGRRAGLVWLHGEACFDAERYRPWIEEAIRRGYVVLAPEVRGCEGYGEEFAARFDPGGADARDVLAAVRVLQADERVDTDRIAVIGWARGGAQALQAALGEDSPVCCAAAVSPFSDLMYRWVMASPEERRRYQSVPALAGGPREAKGEWSRRSLVNRVSELRRPVLLHYAADDELVTAEEIDRLANGIRAADTPGSVLTRFEEGGHGFQLQVLEEGQEPPAAQASSWRELWKFLDVHLMSTAGPEVSGGGGEIPR